MPRSGVNGTYTLPGAQKTQQPLTPIPSAVNNQGWEDVEQTFNTPTPIAYGGTNAGTVLGAQQNLGLEPGVDIPSFVDTRRNRIVNGDKLVSQEHAQTAGTTNGRYVSDQNAMYFVSSAGTFTGVNVLTLSPAGGYRDQITITVADASLAAGEYLLYSQNLEGSNVRDLKWGTADAVDAVARFGFRGPAGTYAYRLGNSAGDRSFVALFTISAPEANTDTVQTIAIPGDATGTWLNTNGVIGITRDIVLACGSTFQGTTGWQAGLIYGTSGVSNGMGTGAAVFQFFDEGFKADPDATGVYGVYEANVVDAVYRSERYFSRVGFLAGDDIATLQAYSTSACFGPVAGFPATPKAKSPTTGYSSLAHFTLYNSTAGSSTPSAWTLLGTINGTIRVDDASRSGAGLVAGNAVAVSSNNNSAYMQLDSRLS